MKMIMAYSLLGAAVVLFLSEVLLIFINLVVKFRSFDYLNYAKILKTFLYIAAVGIILFISVQLIFMHFEINKYICIIKILIYLVSYYAISYSLKDRILG